MKSKITHRNVFISTFIMVVFISLFRYIGLENSQKEELNKMGYISNIKNSIKIKYSSKKDIFEIVEFNGKIEEHEIRKNEKIFKELKEMEEKKSDSICIAIASACIVLVIYVKKNEKE